MKNPIASIDRRINAIHTVISTMENVDKNICNDVIIELESLKRELLSEELIEIFMLESENLSNAGQSSQLLNSMKWYEARKQT